MFDDLLWMHLMYFLYLLNFNFVGINDDVFTLSITWLATWKALICKEYHSSNLQRFTWRLGKSANLNKLKNGH